MAIPRLMLKTDVSGLHAVTFDGQPVSSAFGRIAAFLRAQGRDAIHQLFSEPVESGTNRSWYSEGSGEPVPIGNLPAGGKATAESFLRRALDALNPLLDDREVGPLLRRALVVPSLQSVLALDDGVVLTEWGFGPADLTDDSEALASHVRSVFGPYSSRLASISGDFFRELPSGPPAARAAQSFIAPASVAAPRASVAVPPSSAIGAAVAVPSSRGYSATASGWSRNLWLVPLLAVVAALFLVLGFWLGWTHLVKDLAGRQFQATLGDDKAARLALQTQRDTNAALERELANARRALEATNVCSPENPSGIAPLPERQPIAPGSVPTPAPERKGEAPKPFDGSLASLLEHATAWIVVRTPNGIGSGTGFFITTDTIVTNAHVVQDAIDRQVYVTSKAMGRVYRGQVEARTGAGRATIGAADFALVRLPEVVPGAQPLALTEKVEKLEDVVAAGYPAAIIKQEEAVRELQQGHLGGAPELVLTRGSISSMQQLPNGLTILPHSADISAGNSGGPLVDLCGSVLGINTFVTASGPFVDRTKYALRSDALLQWLSAQNVAAQKRQGSCQPAAATPSTASAPAASSSPASPAAGSAPSGSPKPPATSPGK
jgi:S1-C subfamily serine protease